MEVLERKLASQQRGIRISWFVALIGLVIGVYPLVVETQEWGLAPTLVIAGGLILDPQSHVVVWTDVDGQPVVFGKQGIYFSGEVYPVNDFSCRIEEVQLRGGSMLLEYTVPSRHGRSRHSFDVEVPAGEERNAAELVAFYGHARWSAQP